MGVVYEAEQESPRRHVAVKVIRGGGFGDDVQRRMFQREAETLGRLKPPGIGGIYESGRTEGSSSGGGRWGPTSGSAPPAAR